MISSSENPNYSEHDIRNLITSTQTSMKSMLVYSSIGQMRYVIIGIIVGDSKGGYASMIEG